MQPALNDIRCDSMAGELASLNANKRVKLAREFKEPGYYTIKFGIWGQNAVTVTPKHPVADISWYVRGNHVNRRISVVNGTSISGCCEAVDVQLYDDSDTIGGGNETYNGSIQIVSGVRPNTDFPPIFRPKLQPAFNASVLTLPPGGSSFIEVPTNLGMISVMAFTQLGNPNPTPLANSPVVATGTAYLIQTDSRGATPVFGLSVHDLAIERYFIPLCPSCTRIGLAVPAAAGSSVTFQLIFGVDG